MLVLGLESSCDDSAAAVVRVGEAPEILANVVVSQNDLHAKYGGVVPEIAARAHVERLDGCVVEALAQAGVGLTDIDGIAATAGPGLIGGLLTSVMLAKGLAAGSGKPWIGVNHLEGHALTPLLTDGLAFPYLLLLVSGGHCQILEVRGLGDVARLGGTIDDAPGEAFDKIAKLMGLGYPGGPLVEAEAAGGDVARFAFPRPLMDRPGLDMSFSGLKTAVKRAVDQIVAEKGGLTRRDRADICAGFQAAVAEVLAGKVARALAARPDLRAVAVAGGVAANGAVRAALEVAAQGRHMCFPPMKLCTDNAAMIAFAGGLRLMAGERSDATLAPRPRWPLDEGAAPMLGSGKRGAKA